MDFELENSKGWEGGTQEKPTAPSPLTGLQWFGDSEGIGLGIDVPVPTLAARIETNVDLDHPDQFPVNLDSTARKTWRSRQEPNGTWVLPKRYEAFYLNVLYKGSRKTTKEVTSPMQPILEEICQVTGAFIEAPKRPSSPTFLIWGTYEEVQEAIRELEEWAETSVSEPTTHWAKVYVIPHSLKVKIHEEAERYAARLEYCKERTSNRSVPYSRYIDWPHLEKEPVDFFGPSLEALDPIRIQEGCFILYVDVERRFHVKSERVLSAERGGERMKNAVKEVETRALRPVVECLVASLHEDPNRSRVQLTQVKKLNNKPKYSKEFGIQIHFNDAVLPTLTGEAPSETEERTCDLLKATWELQNFSLIKQALHNMLSYFRVYHGVIRLRINFGVVVLTSYQTPKGALHSLTEFNEMIEHPQSKGFFLKELQHEQYGLKLINFCCNATDLFEPIEPMAMSMAEVEPSYSATLEIAPPSDKSGPILLELGLGSTAMRSLDVVSKKWLRATKQADGSIKPKRYLDMSTIDLGSECAWQVVLACCNALDTVKISPQLERMAASVSFKLGGDNGVDFYVKEKDARVLSWKFRTHYRYHVKDTDAIIEVAKVEQATCEDGGRIDMAYSRTAWETSLYDPEWDEKLNEQYSLGIGQKGMWSGDVRDWFPAKSDNVDGFRVFMRKVHHISRKLGALNRRLADEDLG